MKYFQNLLIINVFLLSLLGYGQTSKDFPELIGPVNDFENVFTAEQIDDLENIISSFEQKTTNEIAIVTINDIAEYSNFDDYTLDLANYWQIGKLYKNNGLVIAFSTNLREISIKTGTGTEKILTDTICKDVIDQEIVPEFKKGEYYRGIKKALLLLISKWK